MDNMNEERLKQLRSDPVGAARNAGFQIPEELAGDPKAMVMHLINSGQVRGSMLQRIMPFMNMIK